MGQNKQNKRLKNKGFLNNKALSFYILRGP